MPTRGTVTQIATVYCRFASQPGNGPQTSYPVPGSGILADVESADGWNADRGDERFVGYVIQLRL